LHPYPLPVLFAMPPKKKLTKKKSARLSEDEDIRVDQVDVQYNPDIIAQLISELGANLDAKCAQLQNDSDFLATSVQQDFHLELIKIPTAVKQMSMKRFKEEFGSAQKPLPGEPWVAVSPLQTAKQIPVQITHLEERVPTIVALCRPLLLTNIQALQLRVCPAKASLCFPRMALRSASSKP
jgi:hypothetical protein